MRVVFNIFLIWGVGKDEVVLLDKIVVDIRARGPSRFFTAKYPDLVEDDISISEQWNEAPEEWLRGFRSQLTPALRGELDEILEATGKDESVFDAIVENATTFGLIEALSMATMRPYSNPMQFEPKVLSAAVNPTKRTVPPHRDLNIIKAVVRSYSESSIQGLEELIRGNKREPWKPLVAYVPPAIREKVKEKFADDEIVVSSNARCRFVGRTTIFDWPLMVTEVHASDLIYGKIPVESIGRSEVLVVYGNPNGSDAELLSKAFSLAARIDAKIIIFANPGTQDLARVIESHNDTRVIYPAYRPWPGPESFRLDPIAGGKVSINRR
jgi:hypothetical protein